MSATRKEYEKLGYSIEDLFSRVDHSDQESEKIAAPKYSYWHSVFRVFFRKKINIIILLLLAVILVFAYVYPMVIEYNEFQNLRDNTAQHLGPLEAMQRFGYNIHWMLGTGSSGQSTFDGVWYGAQISISLALICAAVNMTIGVVVGAIWGFSKKVDAVMMEVYNVIANVPYILLISVLVMLLTASFWTMVFALTVTGWVGIAYFIRTQVVIIRDREYNLASRCLGTSIIKIALKNILPFMVSVIVTLMATEIPSYISSEVFLAFIGIGLPEMSLGRLISENQAAMVTPGWGFEFWSPVAVSAFITVVLYVVGQNLGDASDPRTHM